MPSPVEVRCSPIQGLGVFATTSINAGDRILVIDDSHVTDATHPVPAGEEVFCDFLAGGRVVCMQSPERHINHSCDPNVFIHTVDSRRQLFTLRPIAAGEEIAYDYSINGFGDTVWQCSCGAPRCRHTIHSDFFHLPLPLQLEYLPFLDTWFVLEHADQLQTLRAPISP